MVGRHVKIRLFHPDALMPYERCQSLGAQHPDLPSDIFWDSFDEPSGKHDAWLDWICLSRTLFQETEQPPRIRLGLDDRTGSEVSTPGQDSISLYSHVRTPRTTGRLAYSLRLTTK